METSLTLVRINSKTPALPGGEQALKPCDLLSKWEAPRFPERHPIGFASLAVRP
jgi:hypothetical protein